MTPTGSKSLLLSARYTPMMAQITNGTSHEQWAEYPEPCIAGATKKRVLYMGSGRMGRQHVLQARMIAIELVKRVRIAP